MKTPASRPCRRISTCKRKNERTVRRTVRNNLIVSLGTLHLIPPLEGEGENLSLSYLHALHVERPNSA